MNVPVLLLGMLVMGCAKRPPPRDAYVVREIAFEGNGSIVGGVLGTDSGITDYRLRSALQQRQNARFVWLAPRKRRAYLDEEQLRLDAWRLETWYAHRGYFDAKVLSWEVVVVQQRPGLFRSPAVKITGRIREGQPTSIQDEQGDPQEGIVWEGFDSLSSRVSRPLLRRIQGQAALQPGGTFDLDGLGATEASTRAVMIENTFAHASVRSEVDIYPESHAAQVRIVTEPGPSCTFGPLNIEGSFDIPREIIMAEIAFEEGDPYKASKLSETQQRLFSLGAFSVVNVMPQLTEEQETAIPVTITLTERMPKQLQVGGGLLVESNKQNAHTSLSFRHVNIGNRLMRFDGRLSAGYTLIGQWDLFDQSGTDDSFAVSDQGAVYGAEGTLTVPRAFGLPRLGLELSGSAEKVIEVNYAYFSPELAPSLSYKISRPLMLQLGYGLSFFVYSKYADGADATADGLTPAIGEQIMLSELKQSIVFNTRDNPLSTRRGVYGVYEFTEAGGPLGGNYSFFRLKVDQRFFVDSKRIASLRIGRDEFGNARRLRQLIGWTPELVMAGRLGGGIVLPYGDSSAEQTVPLQERLYLGGSSDVRGWSRNLLGPYVCEGSRGIDRFGGSLLNQIQDPDLIGYGCSSANGYAGINDAVVPIGGLVALNTSLELRRYFVDDTYGLVAFADMGMVFWDQAELVEQWNAWNQSRTAHRDDRSVSVDGFLAPTVGLGMRYNTPIGPVRLDAGYRLDDDIRYRFEQRLRVHLALGETF